MGFSITMLNTARTIDATVATETAAIDATKLTGLVPVASLPVATGAAKGVVQGGSGVTITAGVISVP